MASEFLTISDGTFTLSESENKNQFYFYRNDGEVLNDIKNEVLDLYHAYIMNKMFSNQITNAVIHNIYSEMSDDGKCIRITIHDIDEKKNQDSIAANAYPNFIKKLFHKVFRKS